MDAKVSRSLNELSATEIANAIAAGKTTCEAVVRDCVARIAERDGVVKAFVNFDADLALDQARALDRGPRRGPLHGIPIGLKDTIDTFDMPTEMGSPIYRGNRPRADAVLRRAVAPRRRGDPRQDRDLRIRRQRAAGDHQSAQSRTYAGRLVERLGGGGRRFHGAGGARHANRRLGAASVVVLRRVRLQADLQHHQQAGRLAGRRLDRHHRLAGALHRRHRASDGGAAHAGAAAAAQIG